MTTTLNRAWLAALCVAAGCTDATSSQVLTGHIDTNRGAIAVRAVSGTTVVTAAPIRTDGSFTLSLPAGNQYRLELLTSAGVEHLVTATGHTLHDVAFHVCQAVAPYDVGKLATPVLMQCTDPMDPNCSPPMCGPNDPNCMPVCPDPNNPNCPPPMCGPNDPNCMPPVCPDPNNPNCPPPMCDPNDPNDPNCPPPCTDPNDPMCCDPNTDMNCTPPPPPPQCPDPNNPNCPVCGPNDPMCPCDPNSGMMCPPPPCDDPMDPNTCDDPCMGDPMTCGCSPNDPMCWPAPDGSCDANMMCTTTDSMAPQHPPTDFGCQ